MNVSSISIDHGTPAVDESLLDWMLKQVEDMLVPDNVLDELINPALINSMSELEEYTRRTLCELWGIELSLEYDSNVVPNELVLTMSGSHPRIRFLAGVLSQYIVKNSPNPLEITSITDSNDCIKIELSNSNKTELDIS